MPPSGAANRVASNEEGIMRIRYAVSPLIAAMLLLGAQAALAEPYAPAATDPGKAMFKQDIDMYPMEKMILQAAAGNIPELGAVAQPPYPGAVVVQVLGPSEGSANGVAFTELPLLRLVTADDAKTVAKFYKEALSGWSHMRFIGADYIYEGSGEFQPMTSSAFGTPRIIVVDISYKPQDHAMPDAKTELYVYYRQ